MGKSSINEHYFYSLFYLPRHMGYFTPRFRSLALFLSLSSASSSSFCLCPIHSSLLPTTTKRIHFIQCCSWFFDLVSFVNVAILSISIQTNTYFAVCSRCWHLRVYCVIYAHDLIKVPTNNRKCSFDVVVHSHRKLMELVDEGNEIVLLQCSN